MWKMTAEKIKEGIKSILDYIFVFHYPYKKIVTEDITVFIFLKKNILFKEIYIATIQRENKKVVLKENNEKTFAEIMAEQKMKTIYIKPSIIDIVTLDDFIKRFKNVSFYGNFIRALGIELIFFGVKGYKK